jgi:molybdenum cofactor cytidylyltransferase
MTVAAIILAAGRSTRAAPISKLLHCVDGEPLITRSVKVALDSVATPVIVVIGHRSTEMRAALRDFPVVVVENPAYADGISTSLRAGIDAVPENADGAVVLLGDMPQVRADHIDTLIGAFESGSDTTICVPNYQGQRGNPVLWGASHFQGLRTLAGDTGGRQLLRRHADSILPVAMSDDGVLIDVDTQDDLNASSTLRTNPTHTGPLAPSDSKLNHA